MSQPYPYSGFIDDESGPILPPWYTRGWTAQNAESFYIPAPTNPFLQDNFPADQNFTLLVQQFSDNDTNPRGGFLTFWPSDSYTITENGVSYRVIQSLSGTDTWPSVDAGNSPWAFSMEGSGKIFIYRFGSFAVKIASTDNPNLVTDSGDPLTYHVVEHFLGGRQYDITAAFTNNQGNLYDQIIPGTIHPYNFDPMNPMGDLQPWISGHEDEPDPFCTSQSAEATQYVSATINANVNPTSDLVYMAFPVQGTTPVTWFEVDWTSVNYPYSAHALVGPTGGIVDLAAGPYDIWVKISAPPETPVFKAGKLIITP